jgi:long-chain acyl-CoA synthetase
MADLLERLIAASSQGMITAEWARLKPEAPAVYDVYGVRSFAELNARANKLVRWLRDQGVGVGDSIALICSNRAEFIEVLVANLRCGTRMTPVNWHLKKDEVAYIIENCEAKAVIVEARFADAVAAAQEAKSLRAKLAIGGRVDGFDDYEAALESQPGDDIADPAHGNQMLYTSGTTGRPKGVHRPHALPIVPQLDGMAGIRLSYNPDADAQLCAGPAYHAAPLAFDIRGPLGAGVPIVLMEKWDSEHVLRLVEQYTITHAHFVPVMFQRMLALPQEVRARFDLGSFKTIIHGAAPCPPEVKRAMIEWVGPKLFEYYAGSEGGAGFFIDSHEWLGKPGSVGKRPMLSAVRILDDDGNPLPNGESGTIYMEVAAANPFSYHKDPEKTASSHRDGFFTLGDVGFFDEDDYLFLTGRSAECIISGGVNIYPQEIDNEILKHPSVEDSCTVGAPNGEWGEEVRGVVKLKPGVAPSDALKAEIAAFAREKLAGFKVPRAIDFVDEIPRTTTGKLLRREVRERYWAGRARKI